MSNDINDYSKLIYLTGDVRVADYARQNSQSDTEIEGLTFLFQLQDLMEKFGVIKIDLCIDPFKFNKIKNEKQ